MKIKNRNLKETYYLLVIVEGEMEEHWTTVEAD